MFGFWGAKHHFPVAIRFLDRVWRPKIVGVNTDQLGLVWGASWLLSKIGKLFSLV